MGGSTVYRDSDLVKLDAAKREVSNSTLYFEVIAKIQGSR